MTPDELRALADEATPGPWLAKDIWDGTDFVGSDPRWYVDGPELLGYEGEIKQADARLIALAPDLARLCADMADALRSVVDFHYPNNDLYYSRSLLAKLSELKPT